MDGQGSEGFMARESGFSLIEVLIAMAIAAMMVIGGFQLFGQTAERSSTLYFQSARIRIFIGSLIPPASWLPVEQDAGRNQQFDCARESRVRPRLETVKTQST